MAKEIMILWATLVAVSILLMARIEKVNKIHWEQNKLEREGWHKCDMMIIDAINQK